MMFEQLYYFTEVYRYRSISYAAEVLHISRQALSQSMKHLESSLGIELFIRMKKGVVPTKAADMLFESARIILNEEKKIKRNILLMQEETTMEERYAISAFRAYVSNFGEWLIAGLLDAFPDKNFVLATISNSDDESVVQYDINIQTKLTRQTRTSMKIPSNYVCRQIRTFPLYIWVRKDHELVKMKEISYATLRSYTLNTLNNVNNGKELSILLDLGYDPMVEVPSNLKEAILKEGHYTFDFVLGGQKLMFHDLFDDERFICIQTIEQMYCYFIYRKDLDEDIVSRAITLFKKSLDK